jgi:hypothetical protein
VEFAISQPKPAGPAARSDNTQQRGVDQQPKLYLAMNESKQQYDSSHITPQKQYSQQAQQSSAQQPNGSATKPTAGTNGKSNAAHLTPLRVPDRTLEADDTLFSESFVKKLTPRSMEACRLLGVLPEELVLRSYENFFEAGITPNIQKLRYQDYEQMRQETIAMVREERATLLAQGWTEAISPSQKLKIQQATLKAMMLPTAEGRSAANSPVRGASATHGRGASGSMPTLAKSATTGDLHNDHPHQGRSALLPHLMPEELLLEMEQDRLRKTMVRQNKVSRNETEEELAPACAAARIVWHSEVPCSNHVPQPCRCWIDLARGGSLIYQASADNCCLSSSFSCRKSSR